jgi:dephospho-CoA kinase
MKKIAITGSIASGKSTLLQELQRRGLPVFNCDDVIRELYNKSEVLKVLKSNIPCVFINNALQKEKLMQEVLRDDSTLKKLESILYPYLYLQIKEFESYYRRKGFMAIFIEIPLLFERNNHIFYDDIVVVLSNYRRRKNNFLARGGGYNLFAMLNNRQWNDAKKHSFARRHRYVIFQLHSKVLLKNKVDILLHKIA